MESGNQPVLVTVRQAAAALGMAPTSLYRLCQSGRVPSYAAGEKLTGVRVDIVEVRAALRRQGAPDWKEVRR